MSQEGIFNTAAYIRLSREDGDKSESDSVANQRKLITEFLKGKEEFAIYDIYIDDGYTGTNTNRPAFRRMIADMEEGRINCVIVKDLSRFGRDYIDTGRYVERFFPEHDIRFISIIDHIDSLKQAYDMLLPIKNIFNEQYARDISQKIHASVNTKQKAGEFIGAFPSYGYRKSEGDKNKLVIDPYAAEVVRKIFEWYIGGCGKLRIAALLNQQGIVCPSEYKKRCGDHYRNSKKLDSTVYWTYSTVNRVLQNEMYIGNMVQGRKIQNLRGKAKVRERKDWIVVSDTHERILDLSTWEKAQELLKRRTRNPCLEDHVGIFAGYLKCGDCGRALVKKKSRSESGKINYYCGTYVRSGRQYCTPHPISHEVLEHVLLEDLQTIIRRLPDLRETVERNRVPAAMPEKEREPEKSRLQKELEKVRRLKKAVYEDYREELISKEEYLAYRQDYFQKEELLACRIRGIEEGKNRKTAGNRGTNLWIEHLLDKKAVSALDRSIVVEMVQEIRVFEEGLMKVTYRFS